VRVLSHDARTERRCPCARQRASIRRYARGLVAGDDSCHTLEVYEKHFSTYDDYADSSDDSPTLLKADAAAQRQCE
jgi:hypothetical protein